MPQQEKWIGRSRRWQAAIISILSALVGVGLNQEVIEPVRALCEAITGENGLLVVGFQFYAALTLAWSYFRPDNAKVKVLPPKPPEGAALLFMLAIGGSALLLSGCRSTSTITYIPADKTQPTVTIDQGAGGRNCIATRIDPKTGEIDFVIDQAGESDWGGWGALTKVLPDLVKAATAFLAQNPAPLGQLSDGVLRPPAGYSGCLAIFDTYDGEADLELEEAPEVLVLPPSMPADEREALREMIEAFGGEAADTVE